MHKHSDSYKKNLNHRLKIIKGHIDKVINMVEKDRYCLDIIQQTQAIKGALDRVSENLLENHLKTCVRDSMTKDQGIEEKVKEIIEVFKRK